MSQQSKNTQKLSQSESSGYSSGLTLNEHSSSSDEQMTTSDEQPNTCDACTRPVECSCGNCGLYTLCTSGCSNLGVSSGANLIWNGTSPADSWSESELEHHTKRISHAFAHLVKYTLKSFTQNKLPLDETILWLQELEAYRPLTDKFLPLLRNKMEEISETDNIKDYKELFKILHHYWSWYNFYLLEELIREFGDENNNRKLSDYLDKFRTFIEKRKLLPNSEDSYRTGSKCGKDSNVLLVKVDKTWERISLEQIWEVHHYIAEILRVEPHQLYLSSISKGCVCLNFVVPESFAEYALPLCESQKIALLAAAVFKLECGEYVWQDPKYLEHTDRNDLVANNNRYNNFLSCGQNQPRYKQVYLL